MKTKLLIQWFTLFFGHATLYVGLLVCHSIYLSVCSSNQRKFHLFHLFFHKLDNSKVCKCKMLAVFIVLPLPNHPRLFSSVGLALIGFRIYPFKTRFKADTEFTEANVIDNLKAL